MTTMEYKEGMARIKVIGVGGGGCNAVSRMFRNRMPGVEYVCMNTDAQSLSRSEIPMKIRIGEKLTRGLGVGGDPERGRLAAEETKDEIEQLVQETDMIFIAAGMGGGTGTGGAPVVAQLAKEAGALTIAVVTKPFRFEGIPRRKAGEDGVRRLREKVDSLIAIPNDRLLALSDEALTMDAAFKMADDVLRQGVQAIAELAINPGEINLDFADIRSIMTGAGACWMAIGTGKGEGRAVEAARAAINTPLLDVRIEGAKGVLLNIAGGPDLTINEVYEASEVVRASVDPNAYIFFGRVNDPKLENEVRVTLIATGFPVKDTTPEEELEQLYKNDPISRASGQVDLDIPTFLRRQSPNARRRLL